MNPLARLPYNASGLVWVARMFQNPEIALDDLPTTDDLDWQKLHPNFARRLQVQRAFVLLLVGVGLIVANFIPLIFVMQIVLLWGMLAILAAALLVWPKISVPRRGYVVRDRDIVFRSGVIWRSVTAIPFNRIQHVETSNTPLDRKFGLATLQLFTAGGSSGDLKIDGLGKDVAEQLRVYILGRVGASIEVA